MNPIVFWVAFNLFILAMLAIDLGVFHRKATVESPVTALRWCALWVSLALAFNVLVYFWHGSEVALQFFTGYLIEYSLSVDNIFIFILIFGYFKVPPIHQHKVLFWGILGALVLRATLILAGISLINAFHWVMYVFGALLIYSGLKMLFSKGEQIDPEKNPVLKLVRRAFRITEDYRGAHFFVREGGKLFATPLIVVLIVVETTDLVFALDSIPAILSISRDVFVVYTSNVFAILGLRSLYFALAGIMKLFRFLQPGLAAVLTFVGLKMVTAEFFEIPIAVSLGVVGGILAISILLSVLLPDKEASAELK